MKTIKEIADSLGVTKQAIRNEINKQGLQSALQKNGNLLFVPESAEKAVRSAFIARRNGKPLFGDVQREPHSNFAALGIDLQKEIDAKNAIIERLQTENADLVKQIGTLTTSLQDVTQALKAAQALHAGTIQERLETKDEPILDAESKEVPTGGAAEKPQRSESAQEPMRTEDEQGREREKRSFWQRIFKRKA